MKELLAMGVKVKLVTIGKKGTTYFKRRQDKYNLSGGSRVEYLGCSIGLQHRLYPPRGSIK